MMKYIVRLFTSLRKSWMLLKIPAYKAYCKILEILVSRKMFIFGVTTWLLTKGLVPPEIWAMVAAAVVGAQTYLKKSNPYPAFYDERDIKNGPDGMSDRIP